MVKPDDAERGEGVTLDIRADAALSVAFEAARKRSASGCVLVERQVAGDSYRLYVAGDRLLYALLRLPKSVLGDGRSTVAALIGHAERERRNQPVWLQGASFRMDDAARTAVAAAGLSLEQVPAEKVRVPLCRIGSMALGGTVEDVTDRIHPDNAALAERAAALCGLAVAAARHRQHYWRERNVRCWVSSATATLRPDGQVHSLPFATLPERVGALILDPNVDALALLVPSAEELSNLVVSV